VAAAEDLVEHRFAGVAKGGMAEIVAEGRSFNEVFVQTDGASYGTRQLSDLEGVGESGARVVSDVGHEDLGLVLEPTEGAGVEDPITISLEPEADFIWILRLSPSPRGLGRANSDWC
jgi:hypothetical protein